MTMVCNHPKRLEIDRLLVGNKSIRSIGRQFDLNKDSLSNHRRNHLSRQLVKAKETRDLFVSKNMFNLINSLLNRSLSILDRCEKKGKDNTALRAIGESRRTMEFMHEVSVNLLEVQREEKRQERENDSEMVIWEKGLKLMPTDELQKMSNLQNQLSAMQDRVMTLGSGKRPGRRTDLERKKRQREATARHRAKKRAEQIKSVEPVRKRKRRKVAASKPEKPVNEFDAMRDRLGLSNEPEPPKKRGWCAP